MYHLQIFTTKKKKKMLKKALRLKGNNARVKFNSLETNEEHGTW